VHEDGLTHFGWKAIGSGTETIDPIDLIIFSGDAQFNRVAQSPSGRVYVLRFSSSSARHFFWFQDVASDQDEIRARHVNQLIADPFATLELSQVPAPTTAGDGDMQMEGTSGSGSAQERGRVQNSTNISSQDQLRSILAQFGTDAMPTPETDQSPAFTLSDILAPSAVTPFLSSLTQFTVESLATHLPPSVPHDAEMLRMAVSSPEFRRSVAGLDVALRTGALGPLMTGLGLPAGGATGVEAFVDAIQIQAGSTGQASVKDDDKMMD